VSGGGVVVVSGGGSAGVVSLGASDESSDAPLLHAAPTNVPQSRPAQTTRDLRARKSTSITVTEPVVRKRSQPHHTPSGIPGTPPQYFRYASFVTQSELVKPQMRLEEGTPSRRLSY
jgi:hypothetical protein